MPVIPNPDPQVWRMILRDVEKKSTGSERARDSEEESRSEQSPSDEQESVDSSPKGSMNSV